MDLKVLRDTPPWDWPRGADKMILGVLFGEGAEERDRRLAVELAGDFTVINDELVEALLSILLSHDESEKLRGRAAISLGPILEHAAIEEFEDPDEVPIAESTFRNIQASLRALYLAPDTPKVVRRRILEASVRASEDWHEDAVRDAYSAGDEDWTLTAVFSMCWVRGFDDQILEALEHENEEIHYHAVCAAGNWEIDDAWAHVSALVTSEGTDKALLLAAIEAIAGIRPLEAGIPLVDLMDSNDEEIVEAAFEAVATAKASLDDAIEVSLDDDLDDDEVPS